MAEEVLVSVDCLGLFTLLLEPLAEVKLRQGVREEIVASSLVGVAPDCTSFGSEPQVLLGFRKHPQFEMSAACASFNPRILGEGRTP